MKAFHSFRLDSVNQCVWRGDERVTLTPKAFDVLRYLVEHPGRLVTHEEILEALWPKAYVNQEVVKKYILAIRKALQDEHHRPVFIETLPRRGYQFLAQVTDEAPVASTALSEIAEKRIVGRDGALAALEGLVDKALGGRRQIVFVTGEPGIGKTALVDAFQHRSARRPNMRIARGQCVEGFGGKEAYYPMLEALGQLARGDGGGSVVQALATRAPTWLIQFPSLVKASQREALQREILGATRERMLREICETLESLTAADSLILMFEDLHWADPSTLDVLSALARRRDPARLAVVATYRPLDVVLSGSPLKGLKRDLKLHGLCEEIALERLVIADVGAYLATNFAAGLPAGFTALVHRHSSGNPLFMVALLQDMQKKGWIARDNGTWKLMAPLGRIDPGVPENLQQMLDAQFDQLSAPEQQLLSIASVAGERFSAALISSSLDLVSDRVEDLCETLAERRQFIRAATTDGATGAALTAHYEFTHALYREGVYRQLSAVTRSRLHRRIAEQLLLRRPVTGGPELAAELARHFEFGHDNARAIDYLMKVAENVRGRFAYRESIRVLQHALELVPSIPSDVAFGLECRIHELIGDAYYVLGAMADSARSYEAAASHASEAGLQAAQVSALSALVRPLGLIDPDRGIAVVDRVVRVSDGLDDPLLAARTRLLAAATRLFYDKWRDEDAVLCAAAYKDLGRLSADDRPSYHQMLYAHVLALMGQYDEAIAIFDQALLRIDESSSLMVHFFALSGKTMALLRCGRFGELLAIIRDGKQEAAKNGNDPWLFNFREAWPRVLLFDFEGARALCEAMLTSGAEYPTGQSETIARVSEGYAALGRGDTRRAIKCFEEIADPRSTRKFFLHWTWRLVAQLGLTDAWLAWANPDNARGSCDLLLANALATPDPLFRALAWETKARVAMASQNWEQAREDVARALSALEGFAVPVAAWQVHATACKLHAHAGDRGTAEAHRDAAKRHIEAIADSLVADEPLRASFLSALSVRTVLGRSAVDR